MQYPLLLRVPARVQAHVGIASPSYFSESQALLKVSCAPTGAGQDSFSRVLAAFTRQEHSLKGRLKLGLSLARHHLQEPMRWLRQAPLSFDTLQEAAAELAKRQPQTALVLEHVALAETAFTQVLWELIARPGEFPLPLYLIFQEGWPTRHSAELLKNLVLTQGLAALTVAPELLGTHPLEDELVWFSRLVDPGPGQAGLEPTAAEEALAAAALELDLLTVEALAVTQEPPHGLAPLDCPTAPTPSQATSVEDPEWTLLMHEELSHMGFEKVPATPSVSAKAEAARAEAARAEAARAEAARAEAARAEAARAEAARAEAARAEAARAEAARAEAARAEAARAEAARAEAARAEAARAEAARAEAARAEAARAEAARAEAARAEAARAEAARAEAARAEAARAEAARAEAARAEAARAEAARAEAARAEAARAEAARAEAARAEAARAEAARAEAARAEAARAEAASYQQSVLRLLETAQALEENGALDQAVEHYLAGSLLAQDLTLWSEAKRCIDGGLSLARMSPSTPRRLQLELLLGRARVAWALAGSREALAESGAAQWFEVAHQRLVEADPACLQALVKVTGAGIALELGTMRERWQVRRELLALGPQLEGLVVSLPTPGPATRQVTLADSGTVRELPVWEPGREQHRSLARALELLAQAEYQLHLREEAFSHLDLALRLRKQVQDEPVIARLEQLRHQQQAELARPSASELSH